VFFLDLKSFRSPFSPFPHPPPPSPFDVSDLSVYLAARHRIIPVVIFEMLMNFNPHTDFVGAKFDYITVFNHTNKTLLAGSIRWSCCNLRGHWEHQTNFNQQQTRDVKFVAILIIYHDSWRGFALPIDIYKCQIFGIGDAKIADVEELKVTWWEIWRVNWIGNFRLFSDKILMDRTPVMIHEVVHVHEQLVLANTLLSIHIFLL
jgi:hypothetical protein